ncbi:MAG TPA: TolC family protein [Polyangia bacterium]|jgi:outer membrane protein|nr:TolC family protein [Polyangia bacterium]
MRRRFVLPLAAMLAMLISAPAAFAEENAAPTDDIPRNLSLDEAVRIARAHQPQLRQAHAQTEAAGGKSDESRAPLLPQVNSNASYLFNDSWPQNSTAVVGNSGNSTSIVTGGTSTSLSAGLTANQLVYDFGQNWSRWKAAQSSEESQRQTELATTLQVILTVRSTYLGARANKALVAVARETLDNQNHHLAQVQDFVDVGTHPEIDLAQARADQATAELQLINAQSAYAISRAQLRQAMGVNGNADFDVSEEMISPVIGEDSTSDQLTAQALAARPEFRSLEEQLRAQELAIRALKGTFGPTLGLTGSANYRLPDQNTARQVFTISGGLTLQWALLEGGLERGRLRENAALLDGLRAGVDLLRQQVTVEVEQARVAVVSSKAAIGSADKALVNARERLRLAEARYQTGIGNAIELGDAQLAVTNAGVQKLQAEFQLGVARAQLMKALGQG